MLPTKSHAPTLAYHAPASRPTTTELVTLQSGIDNLGVKLSRTPLVNCDTRNLREIAVDIDKALDLVMSLSQRLGVEIASRRASVAGTYKITAVGLMLLDQGPAVSPEERVRLAEIADTAYQFTPGEDEHPVAVGSCDLAIHAGNWSFSDERRGA